MKRISILVGLCLALASVPSAVTIAQDTPDDPVATVQRAHALTKAAETIEDYTNIINQCEAALAAGLNEQWIDYTNRLLAWTYDNRGELYAEQGQEAEAFGDFSLATKFDPTRWQAFHNRAVSNAMIGRYEEALEDFSRTIELNDSYGDAFFNRGEVLY